MSTTFFHSDGDFPESLGIAQWVNNSLEIVSMSIILLYKVHHPPFPQARLTGKILTSPLTQGLTRCSALIITTIAVVAGRGVTWHQQGTINKIRFVQRRTFVWRFIPHFGRQFWFGRKFQSCAVKTPVLIALLNKTDTIGQTLVNEAKVAYQAMTVKIPLSCVDSYAWTPTALTWALLHSLGFYPLLHCIIVGPLRRTLSSARSLSDKVGQLPIVHLRKVFWTWDSSERRLRDAIDAVRHPIRWKCSLGWELTTVRPQSRLEGVSHSSCKNDYLVSHWGRKTATPAVVGFIVWMFGRLKSWSVGVQATAATCFITIAPVFLS